MSETIVIYGLYRPGRDIFYVGRTNNLKRRLKEHRQFFKGGIDAVVLDVVDASQWRTAEHAWIQKFRDAGITIANRTEGGDGIEVLRADIKAAISARFKGRVVSEETRRKMSAAQKGKRKNWTAEGAARRAGTQFKPGHKSWGTFTPDMTEDEKEAIRQRKKNNRNPDSVEKMRRGSLKANASWLTYTPEEYAQRTEHMSEARLRLPKEKRTTLARSAAQARMAEEGAKEHVGHTIRTWWENLTPNDRADFLARRSRSIQEAKAKKRRDS